MAQPDTNTILMIGKSYDIDRKFWRICVWRRAFTRISSSSGKERKQHYVLVAFCEKLITFSSYTLCHILWDCKHCIFIREWMCCAHEYVWCMPSIVNAMLIRNRLQLNVKIVCVGSERVECAERCCKEHNKLKSHSRKRWKNVKRLNIAFKTDWYFVTLLHMVMMVMGGKEKLGIMRTYFSSERMAKVREIPRTHTLEIIM